MGVSIDLPFRFDAAGGVASTSDEAKTWSNRIVAVLMTRPSERLIRPQFGSRITEVIFENEQEAAAMAQKEIPAAFSRWLPDLTLLHASASIEKNELEENTLVISVEYLLPNQQKDTTTTRVKLGSFTTTGILIEELQ